MEKYLKITVLRSYCRWVLFLDFIDTLLTLRSINNYCSLWDAESRFGEFKVRGILYQGLSNVKLTTKMYYLFIYQSLYHLSIIYNLYLWVQKDLYTSINQSHIKDIYFFLSTDFHRDRADITGSVPHGELQL